MIGMKFGTDTLDNSLTCKTKTKLSTPALVFPFLFVRA